ncbi:MAG TPA: hypothetical protein VGO48_09950 [Conexibacter sp.]|jgi:hypothetical protein|nr:hypothetical protein [Conexibacter sp.]
MVTILLLWSAAALGGPLWTIASTSNTTVSPGATLDYVIEAQNLGDAPTDGTDYTVTITLPSGFLGVTADPGLFFNCPSVAGETVIVCTASGTVTTGFDLPTLILTASVDAGAAGVQTATVDVSGGGAPSATTVDPVTVSSSPPPFGVDAFDAAASADAAGTPLTQAGGHPYSLTTSIDFNTVTDPSPVVGRLHTVETPKDIVVDLPAGLVGDPTGVSQCTIPELTNVDETSGAVSPICPATAQVGTVLLKHSGAPTSTFPNLLGPLPIYNMTPPVDSPARFGFLAGKTVVVLDAKPRTGGDYGITARVTNVSEGLAVVGTTLTFWGVPSDPSHDLERACPASAIPSSGGPHCSSGVPPRPFFRNPTSCSGPGIGLPTTLRMDSWEHPGDFVEDTILGHLGPGYPFAPVGWGAQAGTVGCDRVPFDPVLSAQPLAGSKAGAPAAMAFDVTLPQSDDPIAPGESDLRKATVTLPEGVRVSPSSADGLQACSPAQVALKSDGAPTCPDASKLGTVTIDTPLLDVPVTGSIYLATPFDNPFGSLVAIYLVAEARGVVIKLPGQVSMDLKTGQITTTFDNNPQLPFSRLHLEFKTGPRSPLVMPKQCKTYTTHAEFVGWNGRTVTSDSSFTLTENAKGKPCPPQFSPGFSAGTESNSAGTTSSFLLGFTREDEDQDLSTLTVNLPRGLTGKIANADLCSDGQAGSDSCPAGAKIGDVTVGAGAGSNPFFITNGRAYLTGPYRGAPFGVAIVVPAVAGPFDLGKVTVRSALFVDKHDATVRIVSDSFPTILQGIPLDVRDVRVDVNKPDFFVNPTSCAAKTIAATLTSTEGAKANASDRFQAADCGSLGFKPRMAMRVGGRGHTRRGQTSAFSTTLTMPSKGQANLRFVRVTLPTTINARLNTINDACTRAEFESDIAKCAHATAGSATAVTPLLRDPLKGTVYFVKNGHPIPDLFVALRGQVDFDLIGRVSIPGGKHLATTFDAAPDVPIRSFTLRLLGGSRTASIGAAANLCSARSRRAKAKVDYIGQNGRVRQVQQALEVGGCGKQKRHRRPSRH